MTRAVPVSCAHLDLKLVEAELIRTRGNIAGAARALGVPSADLRRLATWGPLAEVTAEVTEQALDEAEQTLRAAMKGDDLARRLQAAKALLTLTPAGRARGWGREGRRVEAAAEAKPVTMRWLDS
jgi:hypothetical protein